MIISFKAAPDIVAHLRRQENRSAYIRQLIRREMEVSGIVRVLRDIARQRGDPGLEAYFKNLLGGNGNGQSTTK